MRHMFDLGSIDGKAAPEGITICTAERIETYVKIRIVPYLGARPLKKLMRLGHLESDKTPWIRADSSVRTIIDAHIVLKKA